jgi:hypothetical protein
MTAGGEAETIMTIESWLRISIADAEARGLPALKALLQGLAQATAALRDAQFIPAATGDTDRR